MTSNKKKFVIPQLTVHGDVEEITEAGSSITQLDVPFGSLEGTEAVGGVTS